MHYKRVLRCFILVFTLLVTSSVNSAQAANDQPDVTLSTSQSTLTVGEVVTLTLQLTHTSTADMLPLTLDRSWGDFEVRNISPMMTQPNVDGSKTSIQDIGVTLWAAGAHATPPLRAKLVDAQGNQHEIVARPITLIVTSVLTGTDTELRDLKQQATLPIRPMWPWVVAGGSSAVLLASCGGWLLYRRRRIKSAKPAAIRPDLRLAYQIALDELAQLAQLELPAQQRFKEHYTLAVDILRRYLVAAFGIPAIDQTTSELRQALKGSALSAEQSNHLFEILSAADLVKFADIKPVDDEAAQLLSKARVFVLATQHQSSMSRKTPIEMGTQSEVRI